MAPNGTNNSYMTKTLNIPPSFRSFGFLSRSGVGLGVKYSGHEWINTVLNAVLGKFPIA